MRILNIKRVLGSGCAFRGGMPTLTCKTSHLPSPERRPAGRLIGRSHESFSDIGTFQGQHNVLGIGLGTGPTSAYDF